VGGCCQHICKLSIGPLPQVFINSACKKIAIQKNAGFRSTTLLVGNASSMKKGEKKSDIRLKKQKKSDIRLKTTEKE
jgi:hypothetical protein